MRTFTGIVSQLRGSTVTRVSGTSTNMSSSTRHITNLQFGGHSMELNTRSVPPIHLGDELRVFGFEFNGAVRPMVMRNLNNGYEGGFASMLSICLVLAVGLAMCGFGIAHWNPIGKFLFLLGLTFEIAAGGFFMLRQKALASFSAS